VSGHSIRGPVWSASRTFRSLAEVKRRTPVAITFIAPRRCHRLPRTSPMSDQSNMSTDNDVLCAAYDMIRIVITPDRLLTSLRSS
jgi:hypothetical protein